jgi:hypothetical protein
MIAALIAVVSLVALAQFFLAYARSVLASYCKVELSDQAREVTGISGRKLAGDEFGRLLGLTQICPERGDDQAEIFTVGVYYRMLTFSCAMFESMNPLALWLEREREHCAYFAAVALDRRIAYSRSLIAQLNGPVHG